MFSVILLSLFLFQVQAQVDIYSNTKTHKFGLADGDGNKVTDLDYIMLSPLAEFEKSDSLFVFQKDETVGLLDKSGREVLTLKEKFPIKVETYLDENLTTDVICVYNLSGPFVYIDTKEKKQIYSTNSLHNVDFSRTYWGGFLFLRGPEHIINTSTGKKYPIGKGEKVYLYDEVEKGKLKVITTKGTDTFYYDTSAKKVSKSQYYKSQVRTDVEEKMEKIGMLRRVPDSDRTNIETVYKILNLVPGIKIYDICYTSNPKWKADDIRYPSQYLVAGYVVEKNGLLGYVNFRGELILPLKYKYIEWRPLLYDQPYLILANEDEKLGVYNLNYGDMVLDIQYDNVYLASKGKLLVELGDLRAYFYDDMLFLPESEIEKMK